MGRWKVDFPAACFAALWCLDTRLRAPEGLHSEPSTVPAWAVPSAVQRMPSMHWALGAPSFHFSNFGLQQSWAQNNRQSQWTGQVTGPRRTLRSGF